MIQDIKSKTKGLLRWSEKYTQTDMLYLAGGGFWLSLGQIVSSVAALLSSIAFANLLPKETFGVYRYVLSVVSILTIPALPGITTAITQAVAKGLDGTIIPALKAKIRWGLLSALASIVVAGYYYINGNNNLMLAFLISAAFLPFMDSFGLYTALLNGQKKFRVMTMYGAITQLAATGSLVTALFLTKNLALILLTYFASWTLMRYIFAKITIRKFLGNKEVDTGAIAYGKHLSLIKIANIVASYIDRLFVFHFLGAIPLAIYSLAIALPEQIKGLLSIFDNLAFPKFVDRTIEELKKSFKQRFLRLFLLGIFVIVAYIIISPFLYKLFFPKYHEAIFYSQLFVISMLNLSLFHATTALKAQKRIKELYISNLVSPLFQIAIMLLFIVWQGLLGLIIARIISRFFGSLLDTYLFFKIPNDTKPESSPPAGLN